MRDVLSIALGTALLLCASCEERAPLTQGEVTGIANHLELRDNLDWGEPIEVLGPALNDQDGRLWWQARYADGTGGAVRIILVDDHSGWSRLPPPGYVVRMTPLSKPSAVAPVVAAEGNFVLVLTPAEVVDETKRVGLEREVVRLNSLAGSAGLLPLFSLRRGRDEQVSIVYGWQGDQGIAKDQRVVEWVSVRTPYRSSRWIDLNQH